MSTEWRGHAYTSAAEHHREFDRWFLDRLHPDQGDTVVDLGCGSGEFTSFLGEIATEGEVIGVDPDSSMLEAAERHRSPNVDFRPGRAERLDEVVDPGSADKILSRAVLHWIPVDRYPEVFNAGLRVLKPGGWFHSESAGAGNGPQMLALVDDLAAQFELAPPPRFPDAALAFDVVEAAGFVIPDEGVRTIAQRRRFSTEQMERFLRTQVSVLLTRNVSDEDLASSIVEAAVAGIERMRRPDGTYDQTFVRLEILAQRPT